MNDNNDAIDTGEDARLDALIDGSAARAAPPPGFATRVLAVRTARRRRVRFGAMASAAVGALACAAALVAVIGRGPSDGDVAATGRESVAMGEHVIAVLEPDARVHFDVAGFVFGQRVSVDQPAGRAFYRVDKGTPVVVKTPAGDVEVHGTCFTVSLEDPPMSTHAAPSSLSSRVPSALAGAVMGAVLTVAVLEGSVHVKNAAGDVAVGPGQVATARADRAPTVRGAQSPDPAALKRMRAQLEQLQASLDNAQAAAGGDAKKLLAENQALRDKLRHDDEELAMTDADRKDKEGVELPFPKDLPARFSQDALLASFTGALKEAGISGDVTHIDCDEFPCIVYGDVHVKDDNEATTLAEKMKNAPSLAQYKDDEDNNSWWRSLKKDPATGEKVDDTKFGIAIWPKGEGDAAEGRNDDIGKRVSFRNQTMWNAMKPAK